MGSRLLRLGGLLAAASLLVVGCAGDADEIDESESPLTVPPPTAESPTADAVLDLEMMTDEELLAEAERAYQGFLDDIESLRAAGGEDYTGLNSWATDEFAEAVDRVFSDNIPADFTIEGVQTLLGIELSEPPVVQESEVVAHVCVDNTSVVVRNEQGNQVERADAPEKFWGRVTFVLASDGSHLLISGESTDESVGPELCE